MLQPPGRLDSSHGHYVTRWDRLRPHETTLWMLNCEIHIPFIFFQPFKNAETFFLKL